MLMEALKHPAADRVDSPRKEALLQSYVAQDQLYAAVVQSVNDAIITQALDGTITGWNRAAERMFGFTAEEAIGQCISIIAPAVAMAGVDPLRGGSPGR